MLFRSFAAVLVATAAVQAQAPAESSSDKQDGGFEVVIVYVKPEGGCTTPPTRCNALPTGTLPDPNSLLIEEVEEPTSSASPTASPSATKSYSAPPPPPSGPVTKLKPHVHWDFDTKAASNLIPIPAEKGNKLYYGIDDPRQTGEYAFLTYYFKQPSVNIDSSALVQDIVYTEDKGLSVSFKTDEAYDYAYENWFDDDELILITYTEGCGDFEKDDRCYFKVSSFDFNEEGKTVLARGKPCHPNDVASKGESEWGWWVPDNDGPSKATASAANAKNAAAASGASFSWTPGASTPTPTPEAEPLYDPGCLAPLDKNGLPTACVGDAFDYALDKILGSEELSQEQKEFLSKVNSGVGDDRRRCGWLCNVFNKYIIEPIKDVLETVNDNLAISGDFSKDFTYKLPDPDSDDPAANTLTGLDLTQATSPWGPAILLKAFTLPDVATGAEGHLNIFCVNCGVSGTARLSGRAKWTPLGGIEEGQIEISNDISFLLQIGIEAQISYTYNFETDLFSIGLPGLEFGVITIGPYISVGVKAGVSAAATGKLLAGAELGLQNAHVLIDFVHPENTNADAWEPYVKPILEAEGEVKLSTSLGLPVSIKCGLKIATWEIAVGITEEPSIKGVAQVAASIGLTDDLGWEGGFTESLGCTGISAQLSWRNAVFITITGFDNINLHDTGDNILAQGCIELPPVQPLVRRTLASGHQYGTTITARTAARSNSTTNATVVDITSKVKGSNTVTYNTGVLPIVPYNDTIGYEYAVLTNQGETNLIASCSNGNMYAFRDASDFDDQPCSALWTSVDDTLVADGAQRVMHYYNNTMDVLGVSRLRVRDVANMPASSVVVAWAPYSGEEDGDEYRYMAVDAQLQVFYPMVCEYENVGGAKLFLAADPVKGVETLKSEEAQYTVTGGNIKECYPLALKQGASSRDVDYATYGTRQASEPWPLIEASS